MVPQDSASPGTRPGPTVPASTEVPPVLPPPLPSAPRRRNYALRAVLLAVVGAGAALLLLNVGKLVRAGDSSTGWQQTEKGIQYRNERIGRVPWSVHVVKVDRSQNDLAFFAPLAQDKVLGVNRISDQARAVPKQVGRPIAGVNGDFYERDNRTFAGDPRGLQIVQGELVSAPDTVCVWFDAKGNPHVDDVKGDFKVTWPDAKKTAFSLNRQRLPNMVVLYTPTYGASHRVTGGRDLILEREGNGPWLPLQAGKTYRARVREVVDAADTRLATDAMVLSVGPNMVANVPVVEAGAVLELSTATTPDLTGAPTAIAGGPALIRDGKAFTLTAPPPGSSGSYSENSKYQRHPRSAVGWNDTHIYLLTVDGRQPGLSVGMTIAEMADYFVKLGCTDGMNFDGGVSASMWLSGRITSDPCQGERAVANSLFVVRRAEAR